MISSRRRISPEREETTTVFRIRTTSPERKSVRVIFPVRSTEPVHFPEENVLTLNNIAKVIIDKIMNFLPPGDWTQLSSSSSLFRKLANERPIDLSDYYISMKNFVSYFKDRPNMNITGLQIPLGYGFFNLEQLKPFLPRIRKFIIHKDIDHKPKTNEKTIYSDVSLLST